MRAGGLGTDGGYPWRSTDGAEERLQRNRRDGDLVAEDQVSVTQWVDADRGRQGFLQSPFWPHQAAEPRVQTTYGEGSGGLDVVDADGQGVPRFGPFHVYRSGDRIAAIPADLDQVLLAGPNPVPEGIGRIDEEGLTRANVGDRFPVGADYKTQFVGPWYGFHDLILDSVS